MHWLHDAPGLFHHVGAHEQRLVTDHHVMDQRLASDIRLLGEPVIVAEIDLHGSEVQYRPRAPRSASSSALAPPVFL